MATYEVIDAYKYIEKIDFYADDFGRFGYDRGYDVNDDAEEIHLYFQGKASNAKEFASFLLKNGYIREIKDSLYGKQKTATALTVTVIKSSAFQTLSEPYKRRSTTTKPRLATYPINGLSAKANINQFVDKSKLTDLINNFKIDNAEDFISAIGKCFPQQVEKEENRPNEIFRSKYQLIDFSEFGVKILFRISDHSINSDNIIEDIEETYSIALKSKKSPNTFKPNDLTVTEYVFFTENCDRHRYLLIALELLAFLETSEWNNDFVPADVINHSPNTENLGSYVSNFVNDLKKANEKLKNAQKKQKLNLLKDFFRGRKKVRINSNPPEIGKSPIHAYSYPTGTMYADVRFEQFSEGNGWDYLKVCFVFNDPNYSGGITVYCDALPEYKEFVKTKKSFIDGTPTFSFSKHLSELYSKGEKLDWLKAKKIAKDFNIETETEIMQACELAVVLTAREIAQNGNSIRQQYEEMKDLYERQVTIRPLDTKSRVLQQYSTPCPLGYLLGRFVNKNDRFWNGKILEPSAGNGLLTIAFPPQQVCVNELDEIRVANLKNLGFSSVTNQNASSDLDLAIFPDKSFRGVITNPPFAKLTEKDKIERHGWQINTLDYKMAVLALDKMHNDGKAAVIVGGKLWNAYWKPLSERSEKKVLFGQWKTFLGYLYAQYNVVDVVYIDGDHIYQKQGTSYPIVVILIDGRHDYDEANKPRYVFDPNQDTIINTFDQLFDRINPFLEAKVQDEDSERKRKLLILAQAKIRIAKAKNNN